MKLLWLGAQLPEPVDPWPHAPLIPGRPRTSANGMLQAIDTNRPRPARTRARDTREDTV